RRRTALVRLVVRLRADEGDRSAHIPDFEPGKTPHRDVLAEFADFGGDQLRDADGLVLDKGLLQQADLFVKLFHLAGHDFFDHWSGLAGGSGLGAINVFLALDGFRRNVFFSDELRIARRNVHSNVVDQLFEVVSARDEIAFAVDLDQYANFAAGVNVVAHRTFARHPRRFLSCDRNALFAQQDDR